MLPALQRRLLLLLLMRLVLQMIEMLPRLNAPKILLHQTIPVRELKK
jgi:hypothetical protein